MYDPSTMVQLIFIKTFRTQAAGEIYTVGFAAGLQSTVFFIPPNVL